MFIELDEPDQNLTINVMQVSALRKGTDGSRYQLQVGDTFYFLMDESADKLKAVMELLNKPINIVLPGDML